MSEELYSTSVPLLQKAWDSHSLRAALDCPRKYQYQILEGWVSAKTADTLFFGLQYHAALELYDNMRAHGSSQQEALRAAVRSALLETKGWISSDNRRTPFTLVRSVVWYVDQFWNDPVSVVTLPSGKPAVELSFRVPLPVTTPDGDQYFLCGHLDGIAEFAGSWHPRERKTTSSYLNDDYVSRFSPDIQISLYDFCGQFIVKEPLASVMVDACQVGVGFSRFKRFFAERAQGLREEFEKTMKFWLLQFESFAKYQYWPKNEASCDKWGGCSFREICSMPEDHRPAFLESNFVKRIWNPLDNRE